MDPRQLLHDLNHLVHCGLTLHAAAVIDLKQRWHHAVSAGCSGTPGLTGGSAASSCMTGSPLLWRFKGFKRWSQTLSFCCCGWQRLFRKGELMSFNGLYMNLVWSSSKLWVGGELQSLFVFCVVFMQLLQKSCTIVSDLWDAYANLWISRTVPRRLINHQTYALGVVRRLKKCPLLGNIAVPKNIIQTVMFIDVPWYLPFLVS